MCDELNKYNYNFIRCRLLVNIINKNSIFFKNCWLHIMKFWLKNEDNLEVQIKCGLRIWSGLLFIMYITTKHVSFSFLTFAKNNVMVLYYSK